MRARASEAVIIDGIAREFGRPSLDILPSWLEAAKRLEARYSSAEWNNRR
ncbi:MAG: hypothetical protein Q8T11_12845 [Elusimicrobiota bacterium]|nr:hypothetical protein [Elusimicrobiota bacterium]